MDNLTHTLVGAVLGQAGLKRRTSLGMAALVIGANAPDIDGLLYFTGGDAFGIRRGWTHGPVAMLVLPAVVAGLLLGWDRLRRRRSTGDVGPRPPASPKQLLLLAFLAALTHPLLDFMNTYGVRWLMPFQDVWYYGDAWSIVDPWVWVLLGGAYVVSRTMEARAGRARPSQRVAGWALAIAAAYGVAMVGISAAGRRAVAAALHTGPTADAATVMVSPSFGNPLAWTVVARTGTGYRVGRLSLAPWKLVFDPEAIPPGDDDPAARGAARSPAARSFLHWARFPVFRVSRESAGAQVRISDLRYGQEGWAAIVVRQPAGGAAVAPACVPPCRVAWLSWPPEPSFGWATKKAPSAAATRPLKSWRKVAARSIGPVE